MYIAHQYRKPSVDEVIPIQLSQTTVVGGQLGPIRRARHQTRYHISSESVTQEDANTRDSVVSVAESMPEVGFDWWLRRIAERWIPFKL